MRGIADRVRSELAYLRGAVRMLRATSRMARDKAGNVNTLFEGLVARYGDRLALTDGNEAFTYREMGARANRWAHLALAEDFGKGDAIALLMPNRPEFVCVWQGFAKLGIVTALINTNLVGGALSQCIAAARPKAIVVDAALLAVFEPVRPVLDPGLRVFVYEAGSDLVGRLDALPGTPLPPEVRPALGSRDPCLFIYTSGTTGLPKAANLNHYRVQLAMLAFAAATAARPDDRLYDCLPMYHTVGGCCALGAALIEGGTLVIRKRFSASEFWADIAAQRCTSFAYIGELCRYLLAQPPGPADRGHRVRICFGNGLRPDIFETFRARFALPRIVEFYAATESNVALFNFDSRAGSVGRVPRWLRFKFPFAIVRYDLEAGAPVRGPDGFCIRCMPDEPGEILGLILDNPSVPGARFEGYADAASTKAKVLHDVFAKGDAWFSTGDIMRADRLGYHYFLDRTGDTFRWKGENVSTTQVTEIVCGFPHVRDAIVYGVRVPGREGRAGMAAIVCDAPDSFDLAGFRDHLATELPDYARPLFLRFQGVILTTSTFKPKKSDLAAEGFSPRNGDSVFVFDAASAGFRRFDASVHRQLLDGDLRL